MRVIITGGTGLIGWNLSRRLASQGHEVILLSRNPERRSANLPEGVCVEWWDARTAAGWGYLADGAGAIVNLAGENLGEGRWTAKRKHRILDSRLNAGRAVVEAVQAANRKPGVVIQASAVGYYGPREDEEVIEATPPGEDILSKIVVDWEASTQPVEDLGVRRVITRSALVLSPESGALPRMLLPFRFFVGGPYGSGRQWLPWIHIADEVRAIAFLIENQAAEGAFNLSAPHPLTNRDFMRVFGKVMGRPSWIPVPEFGFRLLFGEMSTMLVEGQRQVPRRLLELGFQFECPEAEAALRDLLR